MRMFLHFDYFQYRQASVAEKGERMPQKSTDFYPKLLAGLVMMPLKMQK